MNGVSGKVDQHMKKKVMKVKGVVFEVYCQVPFYDDERCLVLSSAFLMPGDVVFEKGFYVPRRLGVEGGIAWDIDVLPFLREQLTSLVNEAACDC